MFSVLKYSKNKKNFFEVVKKKLKKHDVVIVKNFLTLKSKKSIFNFLKKTFNLRKDIRISGEFKYLQKDYKRLDIGDSTSIQEYQDLYCILNGIIKTKIFIQK